MVSQKEIIEALREASTQAFYGDFRPLIAKIESEGIAPPDGWVLVPSEPTDEMCEAGYKAQDMWHSSSCDNRKELHRSFSGPRYKAMLAAAPKGVSE